MDDGNPIGEQFMKFGFACFVAVSLVGLTLSPVMAQRRGPRGGDQRDAGARGWLSSLDEGMSESRKTGKPLMVVIRCQP